MGELSKGRKGQWNECMHNEFLELKREICNIKTLALPKYDKIFVPRTDTSNTGMRGGMETGPVG